MKRTFLEMRYFETYYYANIIANVLSDQMAYLVNMHNWHEDRAGHLFLSPFNKWSVLHDFIYFVIEDLLDEVIDEENKLFENSARRATLWVDDALRHHGFKTDGFSAWLLENGIAYNDIDLDTLHDYLLELRISGNLEDLLEHMTNEVFYLLFSNRVLLAQINSYISNIVCKIEIDSLPEEYAQHLECDGMVKRVYIPEWVKRAVYFRERGMCASCNTDLSGIVSVCCDKHYDHIIPLKRGGINDVTNIQLLCRECNLQKGPEEETISIKYEVWY